MKAILALGNPGKTYANTRHNVGFSVIDQFAAEQGTHFTDKPKFFAELAETSHGNEKIILIKPTTYYNETGRSARAVMDFYKLSLDDILIIHDDTDLDFGKIRTRRGGRDAGNNGLKSLHNHIGTDFWHVRIGTDSLTRRQVGDVNFVLSAFNNDEKDILTSWTVPTAIKLIMSFLDDKIEPLSVKL